MRSASLPLGADAAVHSPCGWCDREIAVELDAGVPFSEPDVLVWLPTSSCTNVREEFCPLANLFCNRAHLDSWRLDAQTAPGEALSVERAAALGRRWWSRGVIGCSDDAPSGWR
jgi:hypothetical protein